MSSTANSIWKQHIELLDMQGLIITPLIRQALFAVDIQDFVENIYIKDLDDVASSDKPFRPSINRLQILANMLHERPVAFSYGQGNPPNRHLLPEPLLITMLEALEVERGMRACEIGSRTGYVLALLSEMVGTARNVCGVCVDSAQRWPTQRSLAKAGFSSAEVRTIVDGLVSARPFDRILVTVGCEDVHPEWLVALRQGGTILVPMRHGFHYPILRVFMKGHTVLARVVGDAGRSIDSVGSKNHLGSQTEHSIDSCGLGLNKTRLFTNESTASIYDFLFYLAVTVPDFRLLRVSNGDNIPTFVPGLDRGTMGCAYINLPSEEVFGNSDGIRSIEDMKSDWLNIGSPCKSDYEIEFRGHDEQIGREVLRDGRWVIDRAFHCEVISLTK
ncbi:MAG: hypothetical protein OXG65_16875 [Chloroflexi bacterium]|nr:hypothetical protein [Chloroflexota bacterium]